MRFTWQRLLGVLSFTVALAAIGCVPEGPRSEGPEAAQLRTDWPMYRGDLAGTGHSTLTGITPDNVMNLAQVWRFSLSGADSGEPRSANSQVTPIVVAGVMYLPTANAVVALDPATGTEIWRHTLSTDSPSRRGVAYWPGDNETPARILVTAVNRLIALNAATGSPAAAFGTSGEIDMIIPYYSVPLVYENIVVVGANTPRGASGGIGNARAFDARTGQKIWEFSSVPQPGEVGHETWEGDSWKGRHGVNAWPFYFTMDEERGLVYLPLAAPTPFEYGGDRAGANLFANSIVAVNIRTGEYVWHFQTIHHDLWDHDPPAPPVLFDIPQSAGNAVAALAVTTKSGYLYILNRATGDAIYGVEERKVPASDVPGEQTAPTQPIPSKPEALARVSFQAGDLSTEEETSAEHVAACVQLVGGIGELYNAGPFTPWAYRSEAAPPKTTLLFPGLVGGHNWGGVAFDPSSGYLLAFSQDVGALGWMERSEVGAPLPYVRKGPRPGSFDVEMGEQRWPCQKPPWGRLTAVDSSTGEIVWQKPVGLTSGLPPEKANTGRPGRAAAIVTASGLVFIASTDDNRFRALDALTGDELWVTDMKQRGNANPMTYLGTDGRQYVVIAATDELLAYGLPLPGTDP